MHDYTECEKRIARAKALVELARATIAAVRNHRHTAALRRELDKLLRSGNQPIWIETALRPDNNEWVKQDGHSRCSGSARREWWAVTDSNRGPAD